MAWWPNERFYEIKRFVLRYLLHDLLHDVQDATLYYVYHKNWFSTPYQYKYILLIKDILISLTEVRLYYVCVKIIIYY